MRRVWLYFGRGPILKRLPINQVILMQPNTQSCTSAKKYPASDAAPLRPVRPELRPLRPVRPERPELRPLRPERPELRPLRPEHPELRPLHPERPDAASHPMLPGSRCELLCVRMVRCLISAS